MKKNNDNNNNNDNIIEVLTLIVLLVSHDVWNTLPSTLRTQMLNLTRINPEYDELIHEIICLREQLPFLKQLMSEYKKKIKLERHK